jgi:hypothetical protein
MHYMPVIIEYLVYIWFLSRIYLPTPPIDSFLLLFYVNLVLLVI